ncbi:caldesmon-like [Bombus vosnesenskii]|uniref:Caldesmon-like n=1 Tax=Bombus vosnesenskii TaxID=207650 RepID=A0A6J3LID4_9HYME|nr:caldesmon-like [Bombus vosnesenskii]
MIRTPMKRRNKRKRKEKVRRVSEEERKVSEEEWRVSEEERRGSEEERRGSEEERRGSEEERRGREEEESAPEPVRTSVEHIKNLQTEETTDDEEWSLVGSPEVSDLTQKLSKLPFLYVQAEVIRRAGGINMLADTCSDLTDEEAETLRESARKIIAYTVEMTIRALPIISMERRIEILEAENKALQKQLAEPTAMDVDSNARRLDELEQKLDVYQSLIRETDEYYEGLEKVVSSAPIAERTETEVSDPQVSREVPEEGKATAMDCQSAGKKAAKKKNKKKAEKRQSKKITPGIEEKSSMEAPEQSSEDKKTRNRKLALPRRPRTSAVTITIKKGIAKSYAEVLATARDNIHLTEVGIESIKMRKAITGGVILEVPKDQKREKASALATQLTKVLDPNLIRVAAPYRTAEAKVVKIDISATIDEIRETLAQKGGCKVEDIQLGKLRISKDGLGSVWTRCPTDAMRKLVQAGKITIGWSVAKIETFERRPLQCFRCLEIGHVKKTCTSKENREHLCYRCGISGHLAKECTAINPKCPLCKALGAPTDHRMGGPSCISSKKGMKAAARKPEKTVETFRLGKWKPNALSAN